MRVSTIVLGVLVACVSALAVEHGPLLTALHPNSNTDKKSSVDLTTQQGKSREKRSLLLGAGVLGAGAVGAGLLGAGLLGAGVIGAKAGFIGGALAGSALSGRSYGGYGGYYGGGYGGYYGHGYGGYGGYRSYYPSGYYVSSW